MYEVARKDFAALESRRASGASGSSGASAARDALRSRMGNPTSLRLDEVQPNPQNPRYGDDDPEVAELADTLARVGQLQPALVVSLEQYLGVFPDQGSALGEQPWVVIVGNRRLAAARVAGRPALDVRVAPELDSADAFEDLILIENLQRKDLPPLLEADHLRRRLDRPGETFRSVGAAIGKSHTYVQQRLELLKLIPELQALLRDGHLPIKTGRRLGTLPESEQRVRFEQGPPYMDGPAPAELAAPGGAGNPVATPTDPYTGAGRVNPVANEVGAGSATTPRASSESAGGADDGDGTGGSGSAVPSGSGVEREAGAGNGHVNRVATADGAGRQSAEGKNRSLRARLADVLVHVDNALAELDGALPDGGDGTAGDVLAESQRHLTAARAALARNADGR